MRGQQTATSFSSFLDDDASDSASVHSPPVCVLGPVRKSPLPACFARRFRVGAVAWRAFSSRRRTRAKLLHRLPQMVPSKTNLGRCVTGLASRAVLAWASCCRSTEVWAWRSSSEFPGATEAGLGRSKYWRGPSRRGHSETHQAARQPHAEPRANPPISTAACAVRTHPRRPASPMPPLRCRCRNIEHA